MTGRRVLIVDDDADMTAMLARHLEREGMVVVAATGGRAALHALASQESDVVVTDLVVDQVGGLEVLTAEGRCRPAPRVILMTAFGTLETASVRWAGRPPCSWTFGSWRPPTRICRP